MMTKLTVRSLSISCRRRGGFRVTAFACIALISLSVGTSAGPILPAQVKWRGGIRTLLNLKTLGLSIRVDQVTEAAAQFTKSTLETRIRTRFAKAGIEIVADDVETPMMIVDCHSLTERRVDNAIACIFVLTVLQDIHVKRLDMGLWAPTYTYTRLILEHKDDLPEKASDSIDVMINGFLQNVKLGSVLR